MDETSWPGVVVEVFVFVCIPASLHHKGESIMSIRQSLLIRMSLVSCVLVGLLASGGIIPTAVQAAPAITSPAPGSTLAGSTETFDWTAGGSAGRLRGCSGLVEMDALKMIGRIINE